MLANIEQPGLIFSNRNSNLSQLLPKKPLFSSQTLDWAGTFIEYHHQSTWETPYFSSSYHSIIVNNSHQMPIGRWSGDRKLHQQFNKGDITILPANTQNKQSWNREWEFFLLYLDPKNMTRIAYESIGIQSLEILPCFATPDPLVYQFCLELISELRAGESCCHLYVEHLIAALSIHLIRQYSVKNQSLRDANGLPNSKLQQAISYINEHLTENLSLKDIANVVGMSPFYFTNLFKQSTGMTAYQYVVYHRIERAKQLLRKQGLSIAEVSEQVGFKSQSHFANVFRKHTKKTPKMYRLDTK
ncbi:AraC family transcriptional regulator [Chamaesiphon sp. VAR_69_metabat_338]|uniref:helix-turn-helix domain-containing protein n=1 Tax=Chamaesiphon sp. VAR_69_metabat_338 TaxID=2964704 RepID=UPI00286DE7E5|nr:AraC family transcriptional regulator [Chamaesiphon sp. VAR_69_metabat_338]